MNRPTLYQKTVDKLVEAYFNDTLKHGSCSACAVGNILGFKDWFLLFTTVINPPIEGCQQVLQTDGKMYSKVNISTLGDLDLISRIEACGYTWRELATVEFDFESANRGKSKDDWMFNGLCAAIDALDKIHDNTDTEATVKTKARFTKAEQALINNHASTMFNTLS